MCVFSRERRAAAPPSPPLPSPPKALRKPDDATNERTTASNDNEQDTKRNEPHERDKNTNYNIYNTLYNTRTSDVKKPDIPPIASSVKRHVTNSTTRSDTHNPEREREKIL